MVCTLNFIVLSLLLNFLVSVLATSTLSKFSVELIHPNSPKSPLYKYNNTTSRRLKQFFRHSTEVTNNSNNPQARTRSVDGQFLMKISIGTPPVDVYGIADTGSDLLWMQCAPCDGCYKQINPMFKPKDSSTYNDLPCDLDQCHILDTTTCSSQKTCNYTYGYGAGLSQGALAKETIALSSSSGQSIELQNIVFGCGHNDYGSFTENEMGIIGLGGGPISLISQMGSKFGGKKFSQCLVPFHTDPNISGKMSFGNGSEVFGEGVVSTPLVSDKDPTFYFVTMLGISVGDKYLPFNSSGTVLRGNLFLDSGTPPMILPQDLYDRLVAEVRNQIPLTPFEDERLKPQLCYESNISHLKRHILTVHFDGGATVKLKKRQIFIPPPIMEDGVFCFAVQNTSGSGGIYGNFAQSNFLIGFDLDRKLVSFKPTDCTKS